MAIQNENNTHEVSGDGVTTYVPVPFRILDSTHMLVTRTNNSTGINAFLALGADYTIPAPGSQNTGVQFASALQSGYTYKFDLNVPTSQLLEYPRSGAFPAASHEYALDKLTQLYVQLKARLGRYAVPQKQNTATAAAVATSSILVQGPPGWSAAVTAGRTYRIRILGHAQMTVANYPYRVRLTSNNGSGSPLAGTLVGRALYQSSDGSLPAWASRISAIDGGDDAGFIGAVGGPNPNVAHWFEIEAIFKCNESGTVSTLFATATGAAVSVQINVGSTFTVEELPGTSKVPALVP